MIINCEYDVMCLLKENKNETKTKQNKIENTITECCNVKKTKCIEP